MVAYKWAAWNSPQLWRSLPKAHLETLSYSQNSTFIHCVSGVACVLLS